MGEEPRQKPPSSRTSRNHAQLHVHGPKRGRKTKLEPSPSNETWGARPRNRGAPSRPLGDLRGRGAPRGEESFLKTGLLGGSKIGAYQALILLFYPLTVGADFREGRGFPPELIRRGEVIAIAG